MPSKKAKILLLGDSDAGLSSSVSEILYPSEAWLVAKATVPIGVGMADTVATSDAWSLHLAGVTVPASLSDSAAARDTWGTSKGGITVEKTIADLAVAIERWLTALGMRIDMGTPTIIPGTFLAEGAILLPKVKTNIRSPTGQLSEWTAEDANMLRNALIELRSYLITSWPGETAQTVSGTCAGNPALASLIVALERVGVILNRTDNLGFMETVGASDALYCSRA